MRFRVALCALASVALPALAWANCPPRQRCGNAAPAQQSRPQFNAPRQQFNAPRQQPSFGGGRAPTSREEGRPNYGGSTGYHPNSYGSSEQGSRAANNNPYRPSSTPFSRGSSNPRNSSRGEYAHGGATHAYGHGSSVGGGSSKRGASGHASLTPAGKAGAASAHVPAGDAHSALARAGASSTAHTRLSRAVGGSSYAYNGRSYSSFDGGGYAWPAGYGYAPLLVGAYLAPIFWQPDYFVLDYGYFGLAPPPPGYAWIRYGPDLLMIQLGGGQIGQVIHGFYYENPRRRWGPAYADPDELPGDPPPPG